MLKSILKKTEINLYDTDDFLQYVMNKNEELKSRINTINTIVLRGSTADYSFYSKYYPNAFNLGLISSDLHFSYQQYLHINRLPNHIKEVIIFANYSMIGFELSKTIEKNRLIAYHNVFNIATPSNYSFKKRHARYINEKIKAISPNISHQYMGYSKKSSFITSESYNQLRIKTHIRENKRQPNQLKWLSALDEECTNNNHKLYIVLPPLRSDYKNQMLPFNECYKELFNLKLNSGEFIDLFHNPIFNDEDFGDTDHLNENGAKKLTKELYSIIKEKNKD